MPIFEAPRSDEKRDSFLSKSQTTGTQDTAAGNVYLSPEVLTEIGVFLTGFKEKLQVIASLQSSRTKEVREKNEAVANLSTWVRDLWETLRRRVHRLNQPAEVLTFYGLPLDGTSPAVSSAAGWINAAEQIIQGDGDAVAAGYEAMINPSAAEINEQLTKTRTEDNEVAAADREFDEAQEAIAALRPKADELIEEVMAQLRYNLRKKDAPSQRRIMRSYGAEFKYLPGEPVEEDTTTGE